MDAPIVIARLLLVVGFVSCTARAYANDARLDEAQALADRGAAAAARGNYETARKNFEEAYKLTKSAALLLGLGDAQLRTGHFADAANSFQRYLASPLNLSAAQRAFAEKSLQKASKRCAGLLLSFNVSDPTVYLDGALIDEPLRDIPYFLPPGDHLVLVRREGYLDASEAVALDSGDLKSMRLSLAPEPLPVLVEPSAPPPVVSAQQDDATRVRIATSDRSGNTTRVVLLITGSAATVATAGLGTYFYLQGSSDGNNAASIRAGLPSDVCGVRDRTTGFEAACGELASDLDQRNRNWKLSNGFFVGAGVLAAATISVLLFWPNRPSSRAPTISVVPWVQGGATIVGTFSD